MELGIARIRENDESGLLELMESGDLVYTERDNRGRTLLHYAVMWGRMNLVRLLTSQSDYIDYASIRYMVECRGGKTKWVTPLELAALVGNLKLVEYFVDLNIYTTLTEFPSICKRILQNCSYFRVKSTVIRALRSYDLKMFRMIVLFKDVSVDKLKLDMEAYHWWADRHNLEITEFDIEMIIEMIIQFGIYGNHSAISFLLEEFDLQLGRCHFEPYDEILSIPDHVMIRNFFKALPLADKRPLFSDMFKTSDEIVCSFTSYYNFCISWTGNLESLTSEIEDDLSNSSNRDSAENFLFSIIVNSHNDARTGTLRFLYQLYFKLKSEGIEVNYSDYFPRVDLIILNWQISAFKWIMEVNLINLEEQIMLLNDLNVPVSNEDDVIMESVSVEECSICYNHKQMPENLECGHSFCISCIRKMFIQDGSITQKQKCPLCRSLIDPPIKFSCITTLLHYSAISAPWIKKYFSSTDIFPVWKYLLCLAAGSDSIYIFSEIINKTPNLKLNEFTFNDGHNIMHIVCENAALIIFKWLLCNGFESLAYQENSRGSTPIHYIISCNLLGAFYMLNCTSSNLMPKNWIQLAKLSDNLSISERAKSEEEEKVIQSLMNSKVLKIASIQVVEMLFRNVEFRYSFRKDAKAALFFFRNVLLPSERIDVFRLFLNFIIEENLFVKYPLDEFKDSIPENYVHSKFLHETLSEMENSKLIVQELLQLRRRFDDIIEEKRSPEEIDTLLEKQSDLISNLDEKYAGSVSLIDLSNYFRSDPFSYACREGNVNLVTYLLTRIEFKNDLQKIEDIIEETFEIEISKILLKHFKSIDALQEYQITKSLKLNLEMISIKWLLHYKEHDVRKESVGEIFEYAYFCFDLYKDHILNVIIDELPLVYFVFSCCKRVISVKENDIELEILSSSLQKILIYFIDLGFDPTKPIRGKDFVQFLISENGGFILPCIRYLSKEKCISLKNIDEKSACYGSWNPNQLKELIELKKTDK
jgi:ankyrin repeat protein